MLKYLLPLNVIEHLVDNYVFDKVYPIKGSIVYVDFIISASAIQHSGIYVGDGKIVHLDGSGKVEIVSTREFISGFGGLKCGESIYVSCNDTSPVGCSDAASTAIGEVGNKYDYSILGYNCHRFSLECLQSLVLGSDADQNIVTSTLTGLKVACRMEIDSNNWRVWDR